jgi:serine O-acetyltransferase
MELSLPQDQLAAYVADQLTASFPDYSQGAAAVSICLEHALDRVEYCFSRVRDKYFSGSEGVIFDHLHSDKYAMFLYILSNTAWSLRENEELATRIYYLNKIQHAIDVFYQVELPEIFLFNHCIGTVLGRANYSNYLMVHHNCTIGANLEGEYPSLEEGVAMYAGSMVSGRCHIRGNSWISAGAVVLGLDLPGDQVIFGQYPDVQYKPASRKVIDRYFLV